ncbi:MAG: nuoJ [Ignavibacteria bacterium]|nr:nuoJ [Ignavibacteria bacterium]
MDLFEIIFYFFAAIVLVSALVVVLSKNIMYSAFSLLFTFFGVAGLFVLLNADFVGITQIMVYVGGILVLIIFGVMITTKVTGVDIKEGISGKLQYAGAGIITLLTAIFLSLMFINGKWITGSSTDVHATIHQIGTLLMTKYILAFEAAAILLLIAFIGAALIGRRKA